VDSFFGNQPIELIPEFVSDRRSPASSQPTDTHTISFSEKASIKLLEGGQTLHLGFISLMDLHRIHKSLGQRFFDRNIRAGLSPDNPPNHKIRETLAKTVLRKEQPPEVFAFNHNGITLAVADVQFADGHATLKVPRLLNGAQTATSLDKFLEDNESDPALKANQQVLEAIRVLAKIVVTDDREFITQVTICNNQQNPVDPWNLRANDQIQCDLQDFFREEVKIFYSRQENAFQALSDSDMLDLGIEDSRDVKIKPLAQTFLAVQGEIDKISRLRVLFENTKQYVDTFRPSYLHCDARKIVLAYKVQMNLNGVMRRIDERVARKLAYALSKARNLVWCLLIQCLLNDEDLPELLENYGGSLAKEIPFREYLKNAASSKILPILREVLDSKHYEQKLEEEKPTFLSTKEILKTCMDVANKKHGWLKKSL
jgi:hypothetical protein